VVLFAQKKLVSDNSALLSKTRQKIFSIDIELLGTDICHPHKITLMLIMLLVVQERKR
jgi:hypothetical protein